jgi:hypothetical protein
VDTIKPSTMYIGIPYKLPSLEVTSIYRGADIYSIADKFYVLSHLPFNRNKYNKEAALRGAASYIFRNKV